VIAITDARHSGTMNGNKFRSNFFVGEQLMLKKKYYCTEKRSLQIFAAGNKFGL
jgi:hypothetical protein